MVYNLRVSTRAQKEIENAVDYYGLYSTTAPLRFIEAVQNAYSTIASKPHFRVRYKNVRSYKIRKFPYSLFFVVDEEKNAVLVLSCFHNKRNPSRRPD